jgi:hypothetical protein
VVDLWWPFLRSDSVLFHILLYLSARNLEALEGRPGNNLAKQAKMEALRMLNEAVQNHRRVSDQLMIAVANFVTIEVISLLHGRASTLAVSWVDTRSA